MRKRRIPNNDCGRQHRTRVGLAAYISLVAAASGCVGHVIQPGDTFSDCNLCPDMIVVPAGRFVMGSPAGEPERDPDESPRHPVTIETPFAISRFEITRGQYAAFVDSTGHATVSGCRVWVNHRWEEQRQRSWRDPNFLQTDEHPVVCISWDDAQAYVTWLARETGQPYRLLSEAEWEYAARAGSTSVYFFGDNPDDLCVTDNGHDQTSERAHPGMPWPGVDCTDGFAETAPVGSLQPNPFGLHDVHGNVWEWLQDCYRSDYQNAPDDGSAVESGVCAQRVYRGGGWSVEKRGRRAANRGRFDPEGRYGQLGLRVARDLP